jgi:tetratricopeptide (TPR) repeat protein
LLRAFVVCVGLLFAVGARADDLSDFEQARQLYEAQRYAEALSAFRDLIGRSPPRLTDRLLVLESRKYFAASALFVGDELLAREQFRQLLVDEPNYELDPLAFPTEVLSLFEAVRAELLSAQEAERRQRQEELERALREKRDAERLRRQNLARLTDMAGESELRAENSRWLASVPFGVGQFQNGHDGLGVALAMSQGIAAVTSVVTFIGHQRLRNERPSPAELEGIREAEATWRRTNIASFTVLAGLALIGIIDAHVRFVPERVIPRRRPLPPDLDEWVQGEIGPAN